MQKVTETITSRQNPLVSLAAGLAERKIRRREGMFRFDGKKLFREALLSHLPLYAVLLREENAQDNALRFATERRGGYPFLTGCGGNNVFAPLPAPIPNDETPLDIKIDVCGEFGDRSADVRFVITNAKASCDHFKVFLNGVEIKNLAEDYGYKDPQIFWPNPQPSIYTANCLNTSPAPILEIKARVDGGLLKNGTNTASIAVIDRTNYFLDSDSINVERAEIIVGAKTV